MTSITSPVPRSFLLEVAKGTIAGYSTATFVGIHPSVGNDFETVWDPGGDFVYPTAGETWEIVSDSANDDISGTGARIVFISGLDDNYEPVTETVETNGLTPVVTVRTDWFRIYGVLVISSGSSQANEGDITLRVAGGGNIRSKILPTFATTFNGFFTVPKGKTLFLLISQAFVPKNEDVVIRNRVLVDGTNTFINGGEVAVYQNDVFSEFFALPRFPEKTDIDLRAKSTNTNVQITVGLEGILSDLIDLPMQMAGF